MKKIYKRACWYVVDGWICEGYLDKYGFHLTEENWEKAAYKSPWKVKKKDVFFNFDKAMEAFERRYGYRRLMQYFKDKEASCMEDEKQEMGKDANVKNIIAEYRYEHNDGDQIWDDITTFYVNDKGSYEKKYCEGYYGKESYSEITYEEIEKEMKEVKLKVEQQRRNISLYGSHHPFSRGGYSINIELRTERI